jgi:hypothetical protein
MVSSGMLRRVALVRTDVSEELSASFISVTRIGELGATLAVTSNRRTLLWGPAENPDLQLCDGGLATIFRVADERFPRLVPIEAIVPVHTVSYWFAWLCLRDYWYGRFIWSYWRANGN